ncbi:MAG TPA: deoxynucleoside kinase [Kofleriaceae bacterium]|nr:deoxynucleoside kinase [Kofleriaceae bacterium]
MITQRTAEWSRSPGDVPVAERGVYVAVSGNTGAGKSSLIAAAVELGARRGLPIVGVSERTFHHPLLPLMFSDPGTYAFSVQLNFMLQRHMFLLRHLGLGHTIFMERSHLDDEMFVREHELGGHIDQAQRAVYDALAAVLHAELPAPDALLLLDVSPETSIERVKQSEDAGQRPREFPDEESKRAWIHRWYRLYGALHAQLHRRADGDARLAGTRLLDRDAATPTQILAAEVVDLVAALRR